MSHTVRSAVVLLGGKLFAGMRSKTTYSMARLLSGGNMQKLILGRVLDAGPRIVVANQPTRGLDVGAVAYVQTRLDEARARRGDPADI